jgi:MCAfunc domain
LYFVQERLEYIEKDQCEYTFDEEDKKVQDALLNPDEFSHQTAVLTKTLSCSYPNVPLDEALKKEKEKLQMELQRSQSNMDVGQCEVIQHLLGVTDIVANTLPEKSNAKQVDPNNDEKYSNHEEYTTKQTNTYIASRFVIS